jgi:hypothetical protein
MGTESAATLPGTATRMAQAHFAVELTPTGASGSLGVNLGADAILSATIGQVEADGTLTIRSADGKVRARYNAVVTDVSGAKSPIRFSV